MTRTQTAALAKIVAQFDAENARNVALSPAIQSAVVATFERIGWEIREVNINLATGKAIVRLFRSDGRWLYLSASADSTATIERWHRDRLDQRGMGGIGPMFHGMDDRFLGRTRCVHARHALRALADYVAENPAPGREALPATAIRNAVRMLIS